MGLGRRSFLGGMAAALAPVRAAHAQAAAFAGACAYSAAHGGAALVISRSGVRLAESYANGGNVSSLLPLGTATRALAPLLAAALVKDVRLALDEPAAMTLGDWGADPVKSLITVRQLLNGTSGLVAHDAAPDLATLIALTPVTQPGAVFAEDAAPYRLFAEIARRKLIATGESGDVGAYIQSRVLEPLNVMPVAWAREADGLTRLDDGAAATPEAWARIGELMQRDGLYRGQYLVDSVTMRTAQTGSFIESRRGIGLWLAAAGPSPYYQPAESDLWSLGGQAPVDLAMAAGRGGQRLYLIPSRRMVIARLTASDAAGDWSDAAFLAEVFAEA